MGNISIISYKTISVVYNDMSEAKPKEVMDLCMKSKEIIGSFPQNSVYVLANVANIRFNSQVVQIIKETTRDNSPFVVTTAVLGLEGFTKALVKVVANYSNRDMNIVDSYEQGLELLFNKSLEKENQLSTSNY